MRALLVPERTVLSTREGGIAGALVCEAPEADALVGAREPALTLDCLPVELRVVISRLTLLSFVDCE